jgi:putative glutathione S-transferase
MGLLVDGQWHDKWYDTGKSGGKFVREDSHFRHWVTSDGNAGPCGESGFKAEPGRYHLFVSLACPWAHRTLIFRKLKNLESMIGVTVLDPLLLENGWAFSEVSRHNPLPDIEFLHQLYTTADPQYSGRVTVPVLWDRRLLYIVNNESADIVRMFNSAFNDLTGNYDDYYPLEYRAEIDELNDLIYPKLNNGVYRAGFATSQRAYEEAFTDVFDTLDELEMRLQNQRYLLGDRITEADWRLFTTLIRFDAVYYSHFKTNRQRLEEYPVLSNYLRDLYQQPGIAETVNFRHIKSHYYVSQRAINPSGVVPVGLVLDFERPHDREQRFLLSAARVTSVHRSEKSGDRVLGNGASTGE